MEPVSFFLWWLVTTVTGTAVIAYLNWSTIRNWITGNQIPGGYATVIARRLANGRYEVVAGVFGPAAPNTQLYANSWQARQVDPYLGARLGQVIRVQT